MSILYQFFIILYRLGIGVAGLWNPKAREWVRGRKGLLQHLQRDLPANARPIWVHCSSAGELEQAKPLIELLRKTYPQQHIHLTLFSPSGMKVAQKYRGVQSISYLPLDTASHAHQFLDQLQPSLVIFIKYEFWYYHLREIHLRKIPLLLVSAVFRPDQAFFKPWGGFFRKILHQFHHIFVQYADSLELLAGIGLRNISVSGDTRFDRVLALRDHFEPLDWFEQLKGEPLLVAGSTWPDDERLLAECMKDRKLRLVLAPHEIDEKHLAEIESRFPDAQRFSRVRDQPSGDWKVLIIDNVGMLSRLYAYASFSYIGGGFTKDGIHNCLEAAVWGKPVIFGPHYQKYREACELIKSGGAQSFSRADQLRILLYQLTEEQALIKKMSAHAGQFVQSHRGASAKVLAYIEEQGWGTIQNPA